MIYNVFYTNKWQTCHFEDICTWFKYGFVLKGNACDNYDTLLGIFNYLFIYFAFHFRAFTCLPV